MPVLWRWHTVVWTKTIITKSKHSSQSCSEKCERQESSSPLRLHYPLNQSNMMSDSLLCALYFVLLRYHFICIAVNCSASHSFKMGCAFEHQLLLPVLLWGVRQQSKLIARDKNHVVCLAQVSLYQSEIENHPRFTILLLYWKYRSSIEKREICFFSL